MPEMVRLLAVAAVLALLLVPCQLIRQPAAAQPAGGGQEQESLVVGRVRKAHPPEVNGHLLEQTGMVTRSQVLEVEILEGPLKGETLPVRNELTDNPAYNVKAVPGDQVIVAVTPGRFSETLEASIADFHRLPALAVLFAVFVASFMFFGGARGLAALAGLFIAIALVAFVLLPLSLQGVDPLATAVAICVAGTAATIFLIAGFTRKAVAAILGTAGGVTVAGIASVAIISTAHLTGLSSEEVQILRGAVLQQPAQFFTGLLAAGMLIAALGVIMDVAISVASSVQEVSLADRNLSAGELYRIGMNVGRDIMGTMTSTLILAYAGGALPLLMLIAYMPSSKLLNLDLVATEIGAALAGSLGLVFTIPLTALISARLMTAVPDWQLKRLGEGRQEQAALTAGKMFCEKK